MSSETIMSVSVHTINVLSKTDDSQKTPVWELGA